MGFPHSSVGKESTCNAGDPGSTPGLGRSPGEGKGYPLQQSALKNFMDCSHKESETTKWLSLSFICLPYIIHLMYLHLHCCLFSIKDSTFLIGNSGSSQVSFIDNILTSPLLKGISTREFSADIQWLLAVVCPVLFCFFDCTACDLLDLSFPTRDGTPGPWQWKCES